MFSERLKQLRKSRNLTQGELADELGVDRSSIGKYESSGVLPSHGVLLALSSFFGVSLDALIGTAPLPKEALGGDKEENNPATEPAGVRVPLLGEIAAGLPIFAAENIIGYEDIDRDMARRGEYFALRVTGHSMEPKISAGDVIIVRCASNCKDGQVAVVLIGDEATCKRVYKKPEGIWLISDNSADTAPMFFSKKEIKEKPIIIQGVVEELRAKIN